MSTEQFLKDEKRKICDELKGSLSGDIGDIVGKHEKMILNYYEDVQNRAKESFTAAKKVSKIGFGVLIATLLYILAVDTLAHLNLHFFSMEEGSQLTVGTLGVISGTLIEFIAGVNFWLYGRAMKQFNAFHICLERTHRYLIAYKISEKIELNRDSTLEKLVCIMANAPMITSRDNGDYDANNLKASKT